MFLPSDLAPLPVSPRGESSAGDSAGPYEDFVRAGDVRKLLLGEISRTPLEGLSAVDFDSFAGCSDGFCPVPARSVEPPAPRELHPAFRESPPLRRATPPVVRLADDGEAGFGRAGRLGHWWVLGMGLAAAAVLFSGAAVDFISREALRRSEPAVVPLSRVIEVAPAPAGPTREERPQAISAAPQPGDGR